jgi:hypothetical protein
MHVALFHADARSLMHPPKFQVLPLSLFYFLCGCENGWPVYFSNSVVGLLPSSDIGLTGEINSSNRVAVCTRSVRYWIRPEQLAVRPRVWSVEVSTLGKVR